MNPRQDVNTDAVAAQRLVRLLHDPDGYFAQARREAREHARRLLSEQLDTPAAPAH